MGLQLYTDGIHKEQRTKGKQLSLNDHAIRRILLTVQSFVSLWREAVRIPGLWESHRGWQEMPKGRCIQFSEEYSRGISSHKITITHQKCFKEIQSDLFAVKVSPRLNLLSVPIIKCNDSFLPYFRSSRLWNPNAGSSHQILDRGSSLTCALYLQGVHASPKT